MKKLNIRALIRLAINNANESEAGRAAIKVCQYFAKQDPTILNAEKDEIGATPNIKNEATIKVSMNPANRDLIITVTSLDMIQNSEVGRLLQRLNELVKKPTTWNDIHRTTEAEFRSSYWTGCDWGENPFKKHKTQTEPPPRQPTPEDYAKGAKPYDPANPSNYSKTHPKRILKCKTCGKDTETQFVGPPQVFECADCWGKEGFGGL